MEVGVRELKRHLWAYLDRAAGGETIQVTDRGRPKATLGPIPMTETMERGIREGWISPGNGRPPALDAKPIHAARTISEVLDEDGGD